MDRGLEQEERLVTISTDGRVTQWATTKVRLALHRLASECWVYFDLKLGSFQVCTTLLGKDPGKVTNASMHAASKRCNPELNNLIRIHCRVWSTLT